MVAKVRYRMPLGNENNVKTFPKSVVPKVQPPLLKESLELLLLKTSALDLIHSRINRPLLGRSEIGLLQIRTFEYGLQQIAYGEFHPLAVRCRKVRVLKLALLKLESTHVHFLPRRGFQIAPLKTNIQAEWIAHLKGDAQQLAFLKTHVLETGSEGLDVRQITVDEGAVLKPALAQIDPRKIDVAERAGLEPRALQLLPRAGRIVGFFVGINNAPAPCAPRRRPRGPPSSPSSAAPVPSRGE